MPTSSYPFCEAAEDATAPDAQTGGTGSGATGRWLRFLAWTVVGVCFAFIVSAIAVFTLPVGALLAVVLLLFRAWGVAMLGLIEGAGIVSAVIGLINLDYTPCRRSIVLSPGETDYSCGGFDGPPWLIAGLAVMALVAVTYWWLIRHSRAGASATT